MDTEELLTEIELKMESSVDATRKELAKLRTGRASLALLDGINVDAYGGACPIKQVANLSVPEARLIVIQPWDKSILGAVEKAILKSDLGLTPNNDGNVIRLNIPSLTEERRKDLAKLVKKFGEEGKVALRNHRHDGNKQINDSKKDGDVPEDEAKKILDKIQELTKEYSDKIDKVVADKEKEILEF